MKRHPFKSRILAIVAALSPLVFACTAAEQQRNVCHAQSLAAARAAAHKLCAGGWSDCPHRAEIMKQADQALQRCDQ